MHIYFLFLFQGKLQVEERGAQGFSQPHNFVPHLFVPPSNCDHCYQMIIGILNRGDFSVLLINQHQQVGFKDLTPLRPGFKRRILHAPNQILILVDSN